jgi:hypothetical protein
MCVLGEEQRLMPALLNQAREHPRTDAVVGREIADAELHAASLVVQLAIDHLRGLAAHKREIPAMDGNAAITSSAPAKE